MVVVMFQVEGPARASVLMRGCAGMKGKSGGWWAAEEENSRTYTRKGMSRGRKGLGKLSHSLEQKSEKAQRPHQA